MLKIVRFKLALIILRLAGWIAPGSASGLSAGDVIKSGVRKIVVSAADYERQAAEAMAYVREQRLLRIEQAQLEKRKSP